MNFSVPGYEDMELSTQLVIQEALKRGVEVEVLDRADQFIRLKKGGHEELLRQSNQSSRDSYIGYHVLNNKWVQKQLMKEAGVAVPEAAQYSSFEAAQADYEKWSSRPLVVKPKSTNFGIGIQIFDEVNESQPLEKSAYEKALKEAFTHDSDVLIEDFVRGIECRFLVIDGICQAVLHRVPANVKGDGKLSIAELIEKKNASPLRGKGYKTPLEKIELGSAEIEMLKAQGLNPQSIPEVDQVVYLRKNSNISTGGDSIDYTNKVHESYKAVAVQATQATGAFICGVDIILAEPENTARPKNHAVLELNWNPVMYFHDYPFEGENRHTVEAWLDALGF